VKEEKMSTNPIPVPPVIPGGPVENPDPDNPDLVDPGLDDPAVGVRPGDDSPLSQPAGEPEPDADEDPNEQLPRE
jgi:hypothetical protein